MSSDQYKHLQWHVAYLNGGAVEFGSYWRPDTNNGAWHLRSDAIQAVKNAGLYQSSLDYDRVSIDKTPPDWNESSHPPIISGGRGGGGQRRCPQCARELPKGTPENAILCERCSEENRIAAAQRSYDAERAAAKGCIGAGGVLLLFPIFAFILLMLWVFTGAMCSYF